MKYMTSEEFQAHAEAVARGEIPKKKPEQAPPSRPKVKARRVTAATLNALERRLDRLERSTITTWAAAVSHIAKRDKVTMAEAGRRAAKEFKHLHPANRRRQ